MFAPAVAEAVSVSSGEGVGQQHRTASYQSGAKVDGYLQTKTGHPDARGETISATGLGCDPAKVKSCTARDISGAPDAYGSWSSLY